MAGNPQPRSPGRSGESEQVSNTVSAIGDLDPRYSMLAPQSALTTGAVDPPLHAGVGPRSDSGRGLHVIGLSGALLLADHLALGRLG